MSNDAVTVHVAQGELRGQADRGVFAFLGIPYAAAPFGPRRMLPPEPPPSWEGIRDATAYGPTCPKEDYPEAYRAIFREVFIPGDECLNLNVWTPDPGASGLPVLVFVHGGSFLYGSGSVAEYRGTAFARDGVVCVTVNYRLGAEGYLYTGDGVASCGLLDQVAALRWVQENIAAFGGDPARVTVAGESAGAMSVTTLLAVPRASGLFAQAITQSGAAAHTLAPEVAAVVTARLAANLGVPPERPALAALPAARVAAAATALAEEIQSSGDAATWGELVLTLLPFCPVVDGDVLPQPPLDALRAGASGAVRLLTGTNRDEARLFLGATGAIAFVDDALLAGAAAGYGAAPETVDAYRAARAGASPGDLLADLFTDWFFRIPAIRVAEAHGAGTWMYRFDWPSAARDGLLRACHAAELPFVFDTLDEPSAAGLTGGHPPQAVADTVHTTWVRFIADGDPGWPAYDTATRSTALLTEKVEVAADPAGAERARWPHRQPA